MAHSEAVSEHYRKPGFVTRRIFNPLVAAFSRWGPGLAGSRVLEVRGRSSGAWRATPVNPLELDGERYLVAARGQTQWVRNLRADGACRLRGGRRLEELTATELPVAERPAVLRAYLKRWKWEVGAFFEGVGPDSADADLLRVAPDHPVFRLSR